jgi:hypothetical protein
MKQIRYTFNEEGKTSPIANIQESCEKFLYISGKSLIEVTVE